MSIFGGMFGSEDDDSPDDEDRSIGGSILAGNARATDRPADDRGTVPAFSERLKDEASKGTP